MARSAARGVAALVGLLLAGCSAGSFYPSGVALPTGGDGVQTVSDAADALDVHRSSASESAKAAIGAIDAFGSFVRDISDAEHVFTGSPARGDSRKIFHRVIVGGPVKTVRTVSQLSGAGDKRVISGSDLVMQPGFGGVTDFCQSSAGYSVTGIPSLDVTFGWESGAFSGGFRAADSRGFATWSAHAGGEIVQGGIGALSIRRSAGSASCPMTSPAFTVAGADVSNAFSIPITLTFHRGELSNLNVAHATFANGESLDASTAAARRSVETSGIVRKGRTQVAGFQANALGDGILTITSTGAQYVINDWIVVST